MSSGRRQRGGDVGEQPPPGRRRGEPPGSRRKQKLLSIHQALTSDPVAVETLRGAAVSEGGLLTDEIRRRVWPKLLSVNVYNLPPKPGRAVRWNHKDYTQVQLDVSRSARRFPPGMRAEQRQVLQEQLLDLILQVLRARPELHYYQGYHDIAVTLLLVASQRLGSALLESLSTHHLRDFMDPTMDSTKHILNYLMPLLQRESRPLHDFMLSSSCTGRRRCWPATATCPASTSFCPRSPGTCPTSASSAGPCSSSSGTRTPSWRGRRLCRAARASPSAPSPPSSGPPPASARTPCCAGSGSRRALTAGPGFLCPRPGTAPW